MAQYNVSNSALTSQCAIDPSIDSSCSCLTSGGGPPLTADIIGPGIRISFYLQVLFLGLLSALSREPNDIANALLMLVVYSAAMMTTSSLRGFHEVPSMSLQDAIVVIYLVLFAWTATDFCSAMRSGPITIARSCNRAFAQLRL